MRLQTDKNFEYKLNFCLVKSVQLICCTKSYCVKNCSLQLTKMTSKIKKNIVLLFQRPLEPAFVAKGDERAVFDIPNEYLVRIKNLIFLW